jgi:hypothetical protein
LSLSTPWRPIGVEVYLHSFLNVALDGGERSASNPGSFTLKKKPVYIMNRKLGGPKGRAGLSGDEKNTFNPTGIRAPGHPQEPSHYTEHTNPDRFNHL